MHFTSGGDKPPREILDHLEAGHQLRALFRRGVLERGEVLVALLADKRWRERKFGSSSSARSCCFSCAARGESARNVVPQVGLQWTFLEIIAVIILSNICGSKYAWTSAVVIFLPMRAISNSAFFLGSWIDVYATDQECSTD